MKRYFKILKAILLLGTTVLGAVNVGVFVFWWHAAEKTMIPPSSTGYTIETLALSVTFLEIVLVVAGFVFAALALFGYVEIRETAVRRATDAAVNEAKDTVSAQLKLWEDWRSGAVQPEHGGTYGLDDLPVDHAIKPGKEE